MLTTTTTTTITTTYTARICFFTTLFIFLREPISQCKPYWWFCCPIKCIRSLMILSLRFPLLKHVFIGHEIGVCSPLWINLVPSLLSLNHLPAYFGSNSISVHVYFALSWWFWCPINYIKSLPTTYSWFWCALDRVKSNMISSLLFSLLKHVFIGHEIAVCAPIWFNLAYI